MVRGKVIDSSIAEKFFPRPAAYLFNGISFYSTKIEMEIKSSIDGKYASFS